MFGHVMSDTEENRLKIPINLRKRIFSVKRQTATCEPLTHLLRPRFTAFQLLVQLFQTSYKKFHSMLSVAASILVLCIRFIRLSPVWTYKVNKMSISGRCKVCRLSITRRSGPQVETSITPLHCQMFHSQSGGNCFVT
jgi:hypothetical protein